jgi:hypothetical protein
MIIRRFGKDASYRYASREPNDHGANSTEMAADSPCRTYYDIRQFKIVPSSWSASCCVSQ